MVYNNSFASNRINFVSAPNAIVAIGIQSSSGNNLLTPCLINHPLRPATTTSTNSTTRTNSLEIWKYPGYKQFIFKVRLSCFSLRLIGSSIAAGNKRALEDEENVRPNGEQSSKRQKEEKEKESRRDREDPIIEQLPGPYSNSINQTMILIWYCRSSLDYYEN